MADNLSELADTDDEEEANVNIQQKEESTLYEEIFFIDNGSQSNIYCSTKLRYPATTQERFLVGTLKGKVSCLERFDDVEAREMFHSSHDMQAREVSFSYIPGGAELISIDAFYKTQNGRCLIVGVTIILLKTNEKDVSPKHFFNIYNALEPGTEFDIDKLAQNCQNERLGFIPYHLFHADIFENGSYETVFLLSGSDQHIHIFRGDDQQKFKEHPCGKYFPEFSDIPGRVTWMDIKNCDSYKRVAVLGCDTGDMRVTLTNVFKTEVLQTWTLSMNGPISSVRLFGLISEEEITATRLDPSSPRYAMCNCEELNLLVTSALEVSVVFLNVTENGLDKMAVLNQSDCFDSVTCSCITDVDCDGNLEILLGTYGQELLVYKWFAPTNGFSDMVHFDLVWRKQFSKPILSVHGLDLMGDGMQELVVVSLTGVHILQHEVETAAGKLLEKMVKEFPKRSSQNRKTLGEEESELEQVIESICSTNNPYNELT